MALNLLAASLVAEKIKESACNAGDTDSFPGSGRSPGERNDNTLQYSYLENSMNRGAQWATVHGVKKNWTRMSNWHCHSPGAMSVAYPLDGSWCLIMSLCVLQVPFVPEADFLISDPSLSVHPKELGRYLLFSIRYLHLTYPCKFACVFMTISGSLGI